MPEIPTFAPKNAKALDKAHRLLAAAEKKTATQSSKSGKAAEKAGAGKTAAASAQSKSKAKSKAASKGKRKSVGGQDLDLVSRIEHQTGEDSGVVAERVFSALLDGFDVEEFYSAHFESRPLHVQRGKTTAAKPTEGNGTDEKKATAAKNSSDSASDSSRFFASVFSLELLIQSLEAKEKEDAKAVKQAGNALAEGEQLLPAALEFGRDVIVESTTGEQADVSGEVSAQAIPKLFAQGNLCVSE